MRNAVIALLLLATTAHAQQHCRAVDGDTIRCGAESVRVAGLDAPEMRGQCPREIRAAQAARDRMAELIQGGVILEPRGRDKYRRLLAIVRDRDGRDVAAVLIREGHAVAYHGRGRRGGWCE